MASQPIWYQDTPRVDVAAQVAGAIHEVRWCLECGDSVQAASASVPVILCPKCDPD